MTTDVRREPSGEQLMLLRRLAAREAARRQQAQQQQGAATAIPTGQSNAADSNRISADISGDEEQLYARTISAQVVETRIDLDVLRRDASLIDTATLERLWRDERRRNDVHSRRVSERLAILRDGEPDAPNEMHVAEGRTSRAQRAHDAKNLARKQLRLQRLEFEIREIDEGLDRLDEPHSNEILALLTRASIASAVKQYDEGLHRLRTELMEERHRLEEDKELLSRLQQVRTGLKRKADVVERKAKERISAKSITEKLESNLDEAENDLSQFLRSLIEISDSLFTEQDSIHRAQLRHLIDTLINKAWDTPADPYVEVSNDYHPSIVAFILRANIATEHPRDARRIRLIDFARSTRP